MYDDLWHAVMSTMSVEELYRSLHEFPESAVRSFSGPCRLTRWPWRYRDEKCMQSTNMTIVRVLPPPQWAKGARHLKILPELIDDPHYTAIVRTALPTVERLEFSRHWNQNSVLGISGFVSLGFNHKWFADARCLRMLKFWPIDNRFGFNQPLLYALADQLEQLSVTCVGAGLECAPVVTTFLGGGDEARTCPRFPNLREFQMVGLCYHMGSHHLQQLLEGCAEALECLALVSINDEQLRLVVPPRPRNCPFVARRFRRLKSLRLEPTVGTLDAGICLLDLAYAAGQLEHLTLKGVRIDDEPARMPTLRSLELITTAMPPSWVFTEFAPNLTSLDIHIAVQGPQPIVLESNNILPLRLTALKDLCVHDQQHVVLDVIECPALETLHICAPFFGIRTSNNSAVSPFVGVTTLRVYTTDSNSETVPPFYLHEEPAKTTHWLHALMGPEEWIASTFPRLESLNMCTTSPIDLAALAATDLRHTLTDMDMNFHEDLTSLENLAAFSHLRFLRLSNCLNLHNIDFVRTMSDLEELDLDNTNVRSLEPLKNTTKLRDLSIGGCECLEYGASALRSLQRLESLNIAGSMVIQDSIASLRPSVLPRSLTNLRTNVHVHEFGITVPGHSQTSPNRDLELRRDLKFVYTPSDC